jgi:hypothetical protein
MDAQRFDTLAKLVNNGRGSRRRVLTALVPAALAAGLPHRTEALTGSECRAKGGLPRKKGNCRRDRTCDNIDQTDFPCNDNPDCNWEMTASGLPSARYPLRAAGRSAPGVAALGLRPDLPQLPRAVRRMMEV